MVNVGIGFGRFSFHQRPKHLCGDYVRVILLTRMNLVHKHISIPIPCVMCGDWCVMEILNMHNTYSWNAHLLELAGKK